MEVILAALEYSLKNPVKVHLVPTWLKQVVKKKFPEISSTMVFLTD